MKPTDETLKDLAKAGHELARSLKGLADFMELVYKAEEEMKAEKAKKRKEVRDAKRKDSKK